MAPSPKCLCACGCNLYVTWKVELGHLNGQRSTLLVANVLSQNRSLLRTVLGSRNSLVALQQLIKRFCQEKLPGQTDLHPKIPQVKLERHFLNTMTFL
jgi:hypothetical protein